MQKTSNVFAQVEPEIKEQVLSQLDSELRKGMADIQAGRVHSASDVRDEMRRDYGI